MQFRRCDYTYNAFTTYIAEPAHAIEKTSEVRTDRRARQLHGDGNWDQSV